MGATAHNSALRAGRIATAAVLAAALWLTLAARADAAITFLAASSNIVSASSITVTKPTGVVSGDVMIAHVFVRSTTPTITSSGWTAIRTTSQGTTLREQSFYKVAGPSEPASYTFSGNATSYAYTAGIVAYSGVDTTTPIDVSGGSASASGPGTCPSVTTTLNGELGVGASGYGGQLTASVTVNPPRTNRWSQNNASIAGGASEDPNGNPTRGTQPGYTATYTPSTLPFVCQVIMLQPTDTLSLTTSASPTFAVTLDGTDQNATYTVPTTLDATGHAPGWNLTVTSTQFSASGGKTLPTTASSVTSVAESCSTDCTTPTNGISLPVTVPAGSSPPAAVKFYNAASSTGDGLFTITPTINVLVPATARTGSYTSTLTIAAASGP